MPSVPPHNSSDPNAPTAAHPATNPYLAPSPSSSSPSPEPLLSPDLPDERPGDVIGPYHLISVLGSGGFGVVWLAERRQPMLQRVAVKVLRPGMDSRSVLARFEQERQALAVMDHPNVARVFDAGATHRGRPYFVMEYVQGEPITNFADRGRLTIRERLELFIPVCEAIQHAHHKGIIHRDIKPSNILVAASDGKPVAKVIDFGIAKATTPSLAPQTIITEAAAFVGTPEYMSPEQAAMSTTDIDTRTDVYALGVVLYELLTGVLPFASSSLRSMSYDEVRRIIREQEPPRPSMVFSKLSRAEEQALAASRQISEEQLRKTLSRDLEWIPLKALRKERERRYPSALALAEDIRRYLSDQTLIAAPESATYRARKFLRRNRLFVGAGAAVGLALIAGIIGTSVGLLRARERAREAEAAREAADRARQTSAQVAGLLRETLGGINPDRARGRDSTVLREILGEALQRLDSGELAKSPLAELELRDTICRAQTAVQDLAGARTTLNRGLELARSLNEDGYYWLAQLLGAKASLDATEGDFAACAASTDEALAIRQRISTADSSELAQALNNVGSVRYSQGNLDEAARYQRQGLEMFRRLHPDAHRETAQALSNLGLTLMDKGDFDQAQSLNYEAVAMSRKLYKGDHPDLVSHLNNLAAAYVASSRLKEGIDTYREVLAMSRRLYPGDHIDTALAINNLAGALDDSGDKAGALTLYLESLEMRRRILPADHPSIAISLGNVGYSLGAQGRLAEAEPYLHDAAAMQLRVNTEDHPQAARAQRSYATLLFDLNRYDEAEPLLRTALAMFDRLGPDVKADVPPTLISLARTLIALNRCGEALPLLDRALDTLRELSSKPDAATVRVLIERARCLIKAKDPGATEAIAQAERAAASANLQADDPLRTAIAELRAGLSSP